MASADEGTGMGIPFSLPPSTDDDTDIRQKESTSSLQSSSSSDNGTKTTGETSAKKKDSVSNGSAKANNCKGSTTPAQVKTTRTRTVKNPRIFEPEQKKKKNKRRGRPKGPVGRPKKGTRPVLDRLLADEKDKDGSKEGGGGASCDGHRKRSRNASDGENRWDRIRAKFKLLLHKIRKDMHFLQVYQQDGWKSSGREKLKPTAELLKARERIRGVKAELREVVKRLTEMNSDGARWSGLQADADGNIELGNVMCTKCGRGDTNDSDDILLCDYAGCFRAYHQNCLTPAIKPEAFPSAQEDWFCWQCECLLDCLQMLEDEFQGQKFESWKDVFPNVETENDADLSLEGKFHLEDSGDSEDDESFKASSSESEDENVCRNHESSSEEGDGSLDGDSGEDRSGNRSARKHREEDDNDDESEDDEFNFMSDAESVGSDELEKLRMDAEDLTEMDGIDDGGLDAGSTGLDEQGRGNRARLRRQRRAAQLGLSDEEEVPSREQRRATVAALAGDGTLDTANILRGRRKRNLVDYVKLNDDLFGDEYREELDGDKASDDEGMHSDSSRLSGGSPRKRGKKPKRKKSGSQTPKKRGSPTIDPFTGLPRKRGRPRKYPLAPPAGGTAIAASPQQNRKRPREQPAASSTGQPAVGDEEVVVKQGEKEVVVGEENVAGNGKEPETTATHVDVNTGCEQTRENIEAAEQPENGSTKLATHPPTSRQEKGFHTSSTMSPSKDAGRSSSNATAAQGGAENTSTTSSQSSQQTTSALSSSENIEKGIGAATVAEGRMSQAAREPDSLSVNGQSSRHRKQQSTFAAATSIAAATTATAAPKGIVGWQMAITKP